MANEFPQLSDVFALDKQVTYKEAVEQVWLPQDSAILSVPSASPIETLTLSGYTITPTVALGAITYESGTTAELHFIDYSNLRDGAIIQIRILDNTYPITIKNGITGNGGIFTNNGEDILLSDYRKIVQLQREGSIWRQVGTIQSANLPITNCITEIPQDIKLELNNGTLTLKAGSKVYVPNGKNADGSNKFDVVVTESDKTHGSWGTITVSNVYVGLATNGKLWVGENNAVAYNTTDNTILQVGINQSSFPIALVTFNNGVVASIDQVFNGFGYIGSTIFALPGVKGLIPNGRNADGTLKNTEFTVDSVWLGQTAYNTNKATLGVVSDMKALVYVTDNDVVYDEHYNKNKRVSDGVYWQGCFAGTVSVSDMKFTSLQPKLPFRAVDYNDVQLKQDEATAVNYDNITNCITEIPQDIKLELNDGKLTLKAGSKVYVPNGFEADGVTPKFDVVVTGRDITCAGYQTAGNRLMLYNNNNVYGAVSSYTYSGDTSSMNSTTPYAYAYFYNTQTNKMYNGNGSSWVEGQFSLPLGMATGNSSSQYTSIDQVFNGFGYIGSTVFALPNVKGLIPNGRNEDGSLKNIEYASDKMFVIDISAWGTKKDAKLLFGDAFTNGTEIQLNFQDYARFVGQSIYQYRYNEDENLWYFSSDSGGTWKSRRVLILSDDVSLTSGVVTSFTPKLPFHAVDYQDAALKQNFQVVSTLPSSPQPDVFYFIPG